MGDGGPRAAYDVAVIGAGPAGSTAAALLKAAGLDVAVFERMRFPRFVIGESLLPSCNDVLEEAKLFERVEARGYQVKNGAVFLRSGQACEFDFAEQFTEGGWAWTWQVPRADFDTVLADGAREQGVPIFFEHGVVEAEVGAEPRLEVEGPKGDRAEVRARFIVDASGYGRVLPKLLGLDRPSPLPLRQAVFTHVRGDRRPDGANRGRIHVIIQRTDVWIWIIPFSDGLTSVGVVAPGEFFDALAGEPSSWLRESIEAEPVASERLRGCEFVFEPRVIRGYSASVERFFGDGYCLVGNAGEFLDPVFSSGVALALQSASRAAPLIAAQLGGAAVDWQREYSDYMMRGIETFRTFVDAWYDGSLHEIFFAPQINDRFKRMICSALAGYVWDLDNPFVREHRRKLAQLLRIIERRAGRGIAEPS